MGTIPFDVPLVPRMYDPVALMLCIDRPMPPALLEMQAHSLSVSYMPSMLSFFMQMRKQDESCGRGVPALKRVGDACVNHLCDRRWYVSMAASMFSLWIPTETLMSICWGLSTTRPFTLSRYERSSVLKPK